MTSTSFARRYGPWAFVAGASEGLGAAFADALAARGLHVALAARRAQKLEALAATLRRERGVEAEVFPLDLAAPARRPQHPISACGESHT
ncbi:MAG TPA: SDR family NAD(P)-dependent oxidoreductase, partial [Polyangiaceae bacterium LLY-WYZ-15_(1-7)]|nr:SDR family NAD(P)-dependent oxidoreductase [Polyangiaceae bacterium LLY-WYZ-15_(1-7)]